MSVTQAQIVRFATELGFDPHQVEQIVVRPESVSVMMKREMVDGGYRSVHYDLQVVRG